MPEDVIGKKISQHFHPLGSLIPISAEMKQALDCKEVRELPYQVLNYGRGGEGGGSWGQLP